MTPHLQIRKLIDDFFGSWQGAASALSDAGLDDATPEMVRKWHSRDAIPAVWFAFLMILLSQKAVDFADYVEGKPCVKQLLRTKSVTSGPMQAIFG